jgi:dTDP-4-dehydrorhamnose reductase
VTHFTPVNEPVTTARFSALYGVWYPHARSDPAFARAVVNQCRAVVLAMQAIRRITPQARLVQTDDLGKTYSTPGLSQVAEFYNERRWLGWDLLCGRLAPGAPMWEYLSRSGVPAADLHWFRDHPCPPDVLGLNHYVTSERWLDERTERYPAQHHGGSPPRRFADIEAARALATPTAGIGPLLDEAAQRYALPLAVTEVHIDSHREDQLRWLHETWRAAVAARERGLDLRAVTVWSLLGSYDWNSLVTRCDGYYEPGAFDLRSHRPRPTALARLVRQLATGQVPAHPVLDGVGWWRRADRVWCPPVGPRDGAPGPAARPAGAPAIRPARDPAPLLITGARGTLGRAFDHLCGTRGLARQALARVDLDITDPAAVQRAVERWRPWAVVNAGGFVRVDQAEAEPAACFRANVEGAVVLAQACARAGLQLLTFSSDLVFDGSQRHPYVETDRPRPLNAYGRSKAEAERRVLQAHAQALVVRTSAFFGPWDAHNFLMQGLASLRSGRLFSAADDLTVSPTYVPDLVHACLDLLVDQEQGVWHLSNGHGLTWAALLRRAAGQAGVDCQALRVVSGVQPGQAAARPRYSALGSARAALMPPLDDALARFCTACAGAALPAARSPQPSAGPHRS